MQQELHGCVFFAGTPCSLIGEHVPRANTPQALMGSYRSTPKPKNQRLCPWHFSDLGPVIECILYLLLPFESLVKCILSLPQVLVQFTGLKATSKAKTRPKRLTSKLAPRARGRKFFASSRVSKSCFADGCCTDEFTCVLIFSHICVYLSWYMPALLKLFACNHLPGKQQKGLGMNRGMPSRETTRGGFIGVIASWPASLGGNCSKGNP